MTIPQVISKKLSDLKTRGIVPPEQGKRTNIEYLNTLAAHLSSAAIHAPVATDDPTEREIGFLVSTFEEVGHRIAAKPGASRAELLGELRAAAAQGNLNRNLAAVWKDVEGVEHKRSGDVLRDAREFATATSTAPPPTITAPRTRPTATAIQGSAPIMKTSTTSTKPTATASGTAAQQIAAETAAVVAREKAICASQAQIAALEKSQRASGSRIVPQTAEQVLRCFKLAERSGSARHEPQLPAKDEHTHESFLRDQQIIADLPACWNSERGDIRMRIIKYGRELEANVADRQHSARVEHATREYKRLCADPQTSLQEKAAFARKNYQLLREGLEPASNF